MPAPLSETHSHWKTGGVVNKESAPARKHPPPAMLYANKMALERIMQQQAMEVQNMELMCVTPHHRGSSQLPACCCSPPPLPHPQPSPPALPGDDDH